MKRSGGVSPRVVGSGRLVRVHQVLDDRDPVFQEQFAFLQAPEEEVVSRRGRHGDLGDDGIQIPVLGGKYSQPRGEAAVVGAGRGAVIHVGSNSEKERLQAGLTALILGSEGTKYNAMSGPSVNQRARVRHGFSPPRGKIKRSPGFQLHELIRKRQ